MITIASTKIVYWDVDNTLLFSIVEHPELRYSLSSVNIGGQEWLVHPTHVQMIRDFKARGHTVVVWSAGGALWAEEVCIALGLSEDVDLVLGKPDFYFDDCGADKFMPENIRYYKDIKIPGKETKYGK